MFDVIANYLHLSSVAAHQHKIVRHNSLPILPYNHSIICETRYNNKWRYIVQQNPMPNILRK